MAKTYVEEVCQMFDVVVLSDIEVTKTDENDVPVKWNSVVALGWHGEPDAGIRYGTMTPWFASESELDEFCKRNIDRFRRAAEECENLDKPVPDASDWQ